MPNTNCFISIQWQRLLSELILGYQASCHNNIFLLDIFYLDYHQIYLNVVYFSTPVLIRHMWQLKTVVFPALVPNTHCAIGIPWQCSLSELIVGYQASSCNNILVLLEIFLPQL